jgi:hypothetical protein
LGESDPGFEGSRIQVFVLQQFYQRFKKIIGASGRWGLPHGLLASGPSDLRVRPHLSSSGDDPYFSLA